MVQGKPERSFRMPEWCWRKPFFMLVTHQLFDYLMIAVIITNVAIMACDYWRIEEDVWFFNFYNGANVTFTYVYYTEFVLKIIALGPSYFRDAW